MLLTAGAVGEYLEQLQSAQQLQEIQKLVNDKAESEAKWLADRARATTLGSLSGRGTSTFSNWNRAVQLWKKEKGAGAAPLLAEGVLFDCLGRLQGVRTLLVGNEAPVQFFADLAADRPTRAAKAFDAALKLDPNLTEARLRAARIRAPKDARAALELERLAQTPSAGPFSYLAAMGRAEAAQAHRDAAGATRWYERALELEPRSTAATIALSALKPAAAVPFDALGTHDPYYTYPCTILTPSVERAWSARVADSVRR